VGWALRGGAIGMAAMALFVGGVWWVTAGKTWLRDRTLRAKTRDFFDCVSQPNADLQVACLVRRHGWTQRDASIVLMHWSQPDRTQPLVEILERDLHLR
jgi:hypothetical protein